MNLKNYDWPSLKQGVEMKTTTLDGRDPAQLAKERDQRKRNYWRAHDKIKTKLTAQLVKEGWRPK